MGKLTYKQGLTVIDEDTGEITADVSISLPKMNLVDVLRLEIASLEVYLNAAKQQLAELEAAGE